MEESCEVRFILLGNGSVGKTCIMLRFTKKPIRVSHIKTIGIDVEKRNFQYQGKNIEIKIWDTAGQERYRNALPRDLFHRLNGALLVYDVTQRDTFAAVQSWMKLIEDNAPENTAIILVANKIDEQFIVAESEGRALAESYRIPFIMTSAKTGENIELAFEELLKVAIEKNPKLLEKNKEGETLTEKAASPIKRCC
ncbi:unnamed protein product [Blepharisma stoltei]|uniref:Uncharacterized protein n=1 Tax=Blepharisma stoltei TaxID=1481888 RepID=A0AAU9IZP3_9CILI|nr:unnamed protein product [Blepharisma stoltei]